jgi:hypothetical protein
MILTGDNKSNRKKFLYPNATFLPQFLPGIAQDRTATFAVRGRKKLKLMYISIKIHFVPHREHLVFPT